MTARLLLATDDAAEPLLSQGETAGQVFRLWRLQRGMDADVDALPEPGQQQLGRLLSHTGTDGRQMFDDLSAVDQSAADTLLEIDDPAVHRHFVRAQQSGEADIDELSSALRRYDELDSNERRFANDVIRESEDGTELLNADVCNSPCQGTIRSVYQYTEEPDGLSDREAKKLLKAYDDAEGVTTGPGANRPGEVQGKLNDLDGDGVEGVRRTMRNVQGNRKGYRGIAGETEITDRLVRGDNDLEPSNVEMQQDIPEQDKLSAQAGAGEDILVVVTTKEFKESYGELLDDVRKNVRENLDSNGLDSDITIKVTTYEELGN